VSVGPVVPVGSVDDVGTEPSGSARLVCTSLEVPHAASNVITATANGR
jgi:hypothetical protein